jgi:hydroxylamine reductase
MFCYQCEQTKRGVNAEQVAILGCADEKGSCGKDATTADLQDLLLYLTQGLAYYHVNLIKIKGVDAEAARFTLYALFTTLTNVNFNPSRFSQLIQEAAQIRQGLRQELLAYGSCELIQHPALDLQPAATLTEQLQQAKLAKVVSDQVDADVNGLRVLILYGLKGVAAYAYHALMLQQQSDTVHTKLAELLSYLLSEPTDLEELLQQALAVGQLNLEVMALLEKANTNAFGEQQVTQVRTTPITGKAILVSGHDLHDLHLLLQQTENTGINIYTHGEMLPAHAYPKLGAYAHLVGNYGGAWQNQQQEFAAFPGPIVVTSNCLIEPQTTYKQRIFTSGPVGWSGIRHISDGNFAPVIKIAQAMPGFQQTEAEHNITLGFGRHTLLSAAGAVVEAVQQGKIKHFFLIGGCDGAVPGRNYYTELAESTPANTIIMTLGCGKYRFNQQDFGTIGELPRLLDIGQCNDAYAAIEVAKALAEAFNCDINELPLSLMVSWFEQKATAVLLSLLALNVHNIRLGPTLPAYLTPNLLAILQERFHLKTNGSPAQDLEDIKLK